MESRAAVLFLVLLLLVGATTAVLATEGREPGHAEAFQRLVGGLGFGPAVDLSDGVNRFDPRLDGSCAENYGPIPGGSCFHPWRADSVFYYPTMGRQGDGEMIDDALFP